MPEFPPPDVDTFARQFRMKYGREMTAEERHFYNLTKDLLENPPEEEQQSKSRGRAAKK